ncbi:hypothetical protein DFH06DRAFT_1155935 [Mycena polygramma]|nr:hypothetical protein DFH06DRAFT_1155935 [Mycena polygramma]
MLEIKAGLSRSRNLPHHRALRRRRPSHRNLLLQPPLHKPQRLQPAARGTNSAHDVRGFHRGGSAARRCSSARAAPRGPRACLAADTTPRVQAAAWAGSSARAARQSASSKLTGYCVPLALKWTSRTPRRLSRSAAVVCKSTVLSANGGWMRRQEYQRNTHHSGHPPFYSPSPSFRLRRHLWQQARLSSVARAYRWQRGTARQ